jgi:hypothetical protein
MVEQNLSELRTLANRLLEKDETLPLEATLYEALLDALDEVESLREQNVNLQLSLSTYKETEKVLRDGAEQNLKNAQEMERTLAVAKGAIRGYDQRVMSLRAKVRELEGGQKPRPMPEVPPERVLVCDQHGVWEITNLAACPPGVASRMRGWLPLPEVPDA